MKKILILFITLALFKNSIAGRDIQVDCSDIKKLAVGSVFVWLATEKTKDIEIKFNLATNSNPEPVEIRQTNWTGLYTSKFNPGAKTIFIIHGFKSGGLKSWVIDLKDQLLKAREANIILIDWSEASNQFNYVNAARNTETASNGIYTFLEELRVEMNKMPIYPKKTDWAHFHFIGHSLGAQVSGQTAYKLKMDNFWKVERITALDPAKPCFNNVDPSLRVGREDADFVDVIHTQAGLGGNVALGLRESIGHIDFYVNTGTEQPECMKKMAPIWDTMICSHKLAYKYFTESVENSINNTCKFIGYNWDGTAQGAQTIFSYVRSGTSCDSCPELGINADKSNKRGNFLVITSSKDGAHCVKPKEFDDKDTLGVIKVIQKLKDAKTPIVNPYEDNDTDILIDTGASIAGDSELYNKSSASINSGHFLCFSLYFLFFIYSKLSNVF